MDGWLRDEIAEMNELSSLINKRDWKHIVNMYQPKELSNILSFKEGRNLAYKMLFNEERDDDLRDFATRLLQGLRQTYSKEWSLDWKNDVFLGDACYITLQYVERYEAYKRAYQRANPPPPSLLISLAGCYLLPNPPITLNEAENLVKKALEKELSIEGVTLLRGIYAEKNDQINFNYWNKILVELEEKNIHSPDTWPDFSDIHS